MTGQPGRQKQLGHGMRHKRARNSSELQPFLSAENPAIVTEFADNQDSSRGDARRQKAEKHKEKARTEHMRSVRDLIGGELSPLYEL